MEHLASTVVASSYLHLVDCSEHLRIPSAHHLELLSPTYIMSSLDLRN